MSIVYFPWTDSGKRGFLDYIQRDYLSGKIFMEMVLFLYFIFNAVENFNIYLKSIRKWNIIRIAAATLMAGPCLLNIKLNNVMNRLFAAINVKNQ